MPEPDTRGARKLAAPGATLSTLQPPLPGARSLPHGLRDAPQAIALYRQLLTGPPICTCRSATPSRPSDGRRRRPHPTKWRRAPDRASAMPGGASPISRPIAFRRTRSRTRARRKPRRPHATNLIAVSSCQFHHRHDGKGITRDAATDATPRRRSSWFRLVRVRERSRPF